MVDDCDILDLTDTRALARVADQALQDGSMEVSDIGSIADFATVRLEDLE